MEIKDIKKIIKKLKESELGSISKVLDRAKLHGEAEKTIGKNYLKIWAAEDENAPSAEAAQRLRQISECKPLYMAGIKEHLPALENTLKNLATVSSDRQGESFLKAAIRGKAISPKMTQREAIEIRKMWNAIGKYDPLWAPDTKAKGGFTAQDVHRASWQREMVQSWKQQFSEQFAEGEETLEHICYQMLPLEKNDMADLGILKQNLNGFKARQAQAAELAMQIAEYFKEAGAPEAKKLAEDAIAKAKKPAKAKA